MLTLFCQGYFFSCLVSFLFPRRVFQVEKNQRIKAVLMDVLSSRFIQAKPSGIGQFLFFITVIQLETFLSKMTPTVKLDLVCETQSVNCFAFHMAESKINHILATQNDSQDLVAVSENRQYLLLRAKFLKLLEEFCGKILLLGIFECFDFGEWKI